MISLKMVKRKTSIINLPLSVPALIRSSYLCGAEDDNSSGKKIPKVGPGRFLHVFDNNNNGCFAIGFYQRWQPNTLPCLDLIKYKCLQK